MDLTEVQWLILKGQNNLYFTRFKHIYWKLQFDPVSIYLFKFNNENAKTVCSKL